MLKIMKQIYVEVMQIEELCYHQTSEPGSSSETDPESFSFSINSADFETCIQEEIGFYPIFIKTLLGGKIW